MNSYNSMWKHKKQNLYKVLHNTFRQYYFASVARKIFSRQKQNCNTHGNSNLLEFWWNFLHKSFKGIVGTTRLIVAPLGKRSFFVSEASGSILWIFVIFQLHAAESPVAELALMNFE